MAENCCQHKYLRTENSFRNSYIVSYSHMKTEISVHRPQRAVVVTSLLPVHSSTLISSSKRQVD